MKVIEARNVSEALFLGHTFLTADGIRRESRNGPVLEYPEPVTTVYQKPCERVLFYPQRDANPFFHLFEALWMLAGRNDVKFLTRYNSRMATYSDDGVTLMGAYGFRWRNHFHYDQLGVAIKRLREFPNDRRTVVAMWDPEEDLEQDNARKDIPCNTHIYFQVQEGRLNMTVCCRSNDMIWGAYGANAVHFSVLQEYMAAHVGCKVGTYWQISNNFHAYLDTLKRLDGIVADYDPYLTLQKGGYDPVPMVTPETVKDFDHDLMVFLSGNLGLCKTDFFMHVIYPMENAWVAWKAKQIEAAIKTAEGIAALDWRKACVEWLQRRAK